MGALTSLLFSSLLSCSHFTLFPSLSLPYFPPSSLSESSFPHPSSTCLGFLLSDYASKQHCNSNRDKDKDNFTFPPQQSYLFPNSSFLPSTSSSIPSFSSLFSIESGSKEKAQSHHLTLQIFKPPFSLSLFPSLISSHFHIFNGFHWALRITIKTRNLRLQP